MRARRVVKVKVLGHVLQVGFLVGPDGMGSTPAWRWKVVDWVEKQAPVPQCWSRLVDWAMNPVPEMFDKRDVLDLRPRDVLPWRPVAPGCRDDLEKVGSCYCGKLRQPDGWIPAAVQR